MTRLYCILICLFNLVFCCNTSFACHAEVDCVVDNGDGTLTAYYDYVGDNSSAHTWTGSKNRFSPSPENRGQPTYFPKSSRIDKVFSTSFNKETSLTWLINNTNSRSTATKNSPACSCVGDPFTAQFSSNGTSVTVSSSKDLSNVELVFCDGSSYKFDNLCVGKSSTFSKNGKQISSVKIKAGCNSKTFYRECTVPQLSATSVCSDNPTQSANWKITNSNNFSVAYTWDIEGTTQSGAGNVAANSYNTLTTVAQGLNTLRVFVDKKVVSTKVASGETCPCPSNIRCDCAGVIDGQASTDQCGVCGGDSSSCKDCAGIPNGPNVVDECGVCRLPWDEGFNSSCIGCDGILNSNKTVDLCGICGGDNSSCKDCAGVPNGSSLIDLCGVCRPANDEAVNSTCKDCAGVPNGGSRVDQCGVCGGDNSSCKDCAGTPNGGLVVDVCGVCGGDGKNCLGCDGTPNSNKVVDICGVCGGDGTTCLDCAGIPNGSTQVDVCGVCNGQNSCLDCAGIPNGGTKVDCCGVCGGDGSTCKDKCKTYNIIKIKKNIIKNTTKLYKDVITYSKKAKKCKANLSKVESTVSKASELKLSIDSILVKLIDNIVVVCDTPWCNKTDYTLYLDKLEELVLQLKETHKEMIYLYRGSCCTKKSCGKSNSSPSTKATNEAIRDIGKIPPHSCK